MIFLKIQKTSLFSVILQNDTGGKKIFLSNFELIILKISSSTFGTIKSKLYFLMSDLGKL